MSKLLVHKEVMRHPAPTVVEGRALHVDLGPNGDLCVWFLRDPAITEQVLVLGTGHEMADGNGWRHLNTFITGAFVFHAFARGL